MSKITKAARGKPCYLKLDSNCQTGGNNETTVFAHLPGAGLALKNRVGGIDFGCPACFNCHNLVDGRTQADPPLERGWMKDVHREGTIDYMRLMAKEGILKA
jgi:hypothetical protein